MKWLNSNKNDDHDCLNINRSVELFKFTISNQCMMAKATCSAYYLKSSICYVELSLFQFQNKKVTWLQVCSRMFYESE